MNSDSASAAPWTASSHAPTGPGPRRRRPWWVYVLWVFGSLAFLLLVAVVSLALYWNHIVKTYTSTQPEPVPAITEPEEKFAALKERWEPYALQFLHPERTIPPFELTAEELNAFGSHFGPFRNRAFLALEGNHVRIQFSYPLDLTKNPRLAGRYFNGTAVFAPELAGGGIHLKLLGLEANHRPLPGWIFRRIQRNNFGEAFNRRPEFDLVVRALERLEFQPDRVVLVPRAPGAGSKR